MQRRKVKKKNKSRWRFTYIQCDQIGLFLKGFVIKMQQNKPKNCCFCNIPKVKLAVTNFCVTFGKNELGTYYSNIRGQSYKVSMSVNYDSRTVNISNLRIIYTAMKTRRFRIRLASSIHWIKFFTDQMALPNANTSRFRRRVNASFIIITTLKS